MKHEPIRGELELIVEKHTDEQGTGQNKRESKTTVLEERLKLKMKGDLYHPNFLLYNAALGLGLTQQDFTTDGDSDRSSGSLNDYSMLAQLLRMKPYPLTVYLNKSEDLIPRRFLGSLRAERQSSGISLALRSEDWPMRFQYSTSETRQKSLAPTNRDFFNRDAERFKYSVTHDFSELSHMSFEFDRNKVLQRSSASSTDLKENRYTLLHDLTFGGDEQHRLDSFFAYTDQSGSFSFENLQAEERLRLQHTSDFLTNYNLRFTDTKQETSRNKEIRGRAGFEHRLYESLVTTGNVFASESDLDNQGKLTQRGGVLGFNYRKKNPWGTLLSTYTVNLNRNEQSGGSGVGIVFDEQHPYDISDLTPIQLDRRNIDISTIVVWDSGRTVPYDKDFDYTITEINGRVRIFVITGGQIFLDGNQTLSIDYRFFTEPKRQEDVLRQDFTVRERFDKGLSLYYAYQRQNEKVSSSVTEITPDEFENNTFGAEYVKKGLALLAEYSKQNSTQISSRYKRLEAGYGWTIDNDTRASVRASNHWLDFGEPENYDIVLFRASGEIFSRLTEKYNVSARIDYRNEDDSRFGITEGIQLTSELQYNYRQLSITTGVELNLLKRRDDEINSSFLYLRLRRFF